MIRLYQNSALDTAQLVELDKVPSHHLIRVLRAKKGCEVTLFNGDGNDYLAELIDDNARHCQLKILTKTELKNESPLNITLLQGVSRGDRMDSCIQKSIELGVHSIVPVFCHRTGVSLKGDRLKKKVQHWQQVVISACEQSGRAFVPAIEEPCHFEQAIQIADRKKFILDPYAKQSLTNLMKPDRAISILIGPEGGFTDDEIKLAQQNEHVSISLGPRILRTETAGPACIAIAQTLWGDLCE